MRTLIDVFTISLIALSCLACTQERLTLQTSYLSRSQLASFHVGTPDPMLQEPIIGERLLVQWRLPCTMKGQYVDLHIDVRIRFKDNSEISFEIPIDEMRGWYEYRILGEEFLKIQGITTCKADLIGDGQILDTWLHRLWVEKITLSSKTSQEIDSSL